MDHSVALEPILKSKAASHFAQRCVGHGPVWLDVGSVVCEKSKKQPEQPSQPLPLPLREAEVSRHVIGALNTSNFFNGKPDTLPATPSNDLW